MAKMQFTYIKTWCMYYDITSASAQQFLTLNFTNMESIYNGFYVARMRHDIVIVIGIAKGPTRVCKLFTDLKNFIFNFLDTKLADCTGLKYNIFNETRRFL